MTLHRIIKATDVFDMAVMGHILYMTVPKQKTVYGYNLHEKKRLPSIQLTHKCYGLDSFDNKIAILLCDTAENDFQIAFMKDVGVVAGKTDLSRGEYQFKKPQYLAVCSLTRLAYVSDRKANLLKCFRLDGGLCWEKVVIGAGPLAIYSGYLIMARAYTSSVDVFAGGGEYKGRLRSVKYAIVRPRCIAAKEHTASFVLVDEDQLIHRFKISQINKIDPKTKAGGSRACAIL
ncbi:hypothetical protein DPMN_147887 [Dreissena polymorpha]|uniref:Uncharacterized protein n=1 Tax=Dreissena polymorpha TaxID=45954 RepID=A0A9D4FAR7_DREPO|nr:hypothetical protein DPMN_147887 [Dreissena polymorpha]